MISALQSQSVDVAIGLTEGWVAGLARVASANESPAYSLVGTYVESPLRWALSTGFARQDVAQEADPGEWVKGLKGKKMGVSRVGSGSYVMGFVMADKLGWLEESKDPFEIVVLETFDKLREGVRTGEADFFMWEHFTSKRYFDIGEIKKIGEIVTPWPSWHIVSKPELAGSEQLEEFFALLDKGIKYFQGASAEAAEYISTELDYSKEDAEEWLQTVQFAQEVKGVKPSVVKETLSALKKAKVVASDSDVKDMIKFERKEPGLLSALTG